MATAIMVSGTADLLALADKINQEHRLCEQSMREGLAHAINAGNLLIEAKSLCPHGTWGDWLQDNCEVSERTAQAYMRVARGLPMLEAKAQRVADLSFRDAVKLLAEPTPDGEREQLKRVIAEGRDAGMMDLIETRQDIPGSVDISETLADLDSCIRIMITQENASVADLDYVVQVTSRVIADMIAGRVKLRWLEECCIKLDTIGYGMERPFYIGGIMALVKIGQSMGKAALV